MPKTRFCLALHEFSCRATREKLQKDFFKIVERFFKKSLKVLEKSDKGINSIAGLQQLLSLADTSVAPTVNGAPTRGCPYNGNRFVRPASQLSTGQTHRSAPTPSSLKNIHEHLRDNLRQFMFKEKTCINSCLITLIFFINANYHK